ncbi:MAG: hypothetical protein RIS09_702 [Actinomycetota bacterium]|jgi:cell division protein FtsQ
MTDDLTSYRIRKRAKRIAVSFLVVTLIAAGTYVVYFSEIFAVKTINVTGSKIVAESEILRVASVEIGTSLARIDTQEISRRLQVFPSIGSVEVRRVWPSEVVLAISERSPVATMAFNDRWKFVDANGVVYGETSRIPSGLIPISAESESARKSIAEVIQNLPASIKRQVLTMSAQSEDSVMLTLTESRQVVWGNAEQISRKVEVLEVLLQRKARFYDVSAPNFPTTRN